MAAPTTISVAVDDTEYSRYEYDKNTVTATVTVSGGAPYSSEPIRVDLVKARRSRDAVVASNTLEFSGTADPQEGTTSFYLPDLVDQDLISLIRHGKYFIRALHEATEATAQIGSGTNGTVFLSAAAAGSVGNVYTIEVVVPLGTNELTVTRSGNAFTVRLATSVGVPVSSKNTAILVANAINSVTTDIVATYSGDGSDSLNSAEGPISFTGGTDEVSAESEDFNIRIVTVSRLKRDYLFGIPLKSTSVKLPKFDPSAITGVVFGEVSSNHPEGFGTLNYVYTENDLSNASASIGSGTDGTVTITADGGGYEGSAGNGLLVEVVVPSGTSPLSASFSAGKLTVSLAVNSGVPDNPSNTASLVASAISALPEFSAVASGTGSSSLTSAEGPTLFSGGLTDVVRQLSWKGGPLVSVSSPGVFVLRAGSSGPAQKLLGVDSTSQDYVCVRVRSPLLLPDSSVSEEILITSQELSDETLGRYIDNALAWVENDFLATYVEPTNVVTDRDPTTVQYTAGVNAPTPLFTDPDYDFIVSPLTYFVPKTGSWVQIWTPYRQILRVDSLFGAIANTRVIDIDLEWIEISEQGGLIQLVPFNQEIAFDFIGLIWVNAIRGAVELPNFWHFNAIVGLREASGDIQELIAKKAAIEALQAASLAFRPGLGSLSLSRDGVSESVSYNTQQQYGVFTGTITAYKEWINDNEKKLRAKYRGLDWCVV